MYMYVYLKMNVCFCETNIIQLNKETLAYFHIHIYFYNNSISSPNSCTFHKLYLKQKILEKIFHTHAYKTHALANTRDF